MKISLILILLVLPNVVLFGQSAISNKDTSYGAHYRTLKYKVTTKTTWSNNKNAVVFENQQRFSSNYFEIKEDSTFIFFSVYEVGYLLTTGNWQKLDDSTYRLDWNKERSIALCRNEKKYKKYFVHSFPMPLPIDNYKFIKRGDLLIPADSR
ncbi:hypothetical protein GCM10027043_38790 [Ferruginibacter profundus]